MDDEELAQVLCPSFLLSGAPCYVCRGAGKKLEAAGYVVLRRGEVPGWMEPVVIDKYDEGTLMSETLYELCAD